MKLENKNLLFWLACVPARLMLASLPLFISRQYHPYLAIVFMCIGIAFLWLYATKSRMRPFESSTGTAWWHSNRVVHGLLFIIASITLAAGKKTAACTALVASTLLGIFTKIRKKS